MARIGRPMLVPLNGFIHLAHRVPSGVQFSIENWTNITYAMMAFGSASVEMDDGTVLSPVEIRLIRSLMSDASLPNRRGAKALERKGILAGSCQGKNGRPTLTERGIAVGLALFLEDLDA